MDGHHHAGCSAALEEMKKEGKPATPLPLPPEQLPAQCCRAFVNSVLGPPVPSSHKQTIRGALAAAAQLVHPLVQVPEQPSPWLEQTMAATLEGYPRIFALHKL